MNFWRDFMRFERQIIYDIQTSTDGAGEHRALCLIEDIGERTGYPLLFQLGRDMRNGKKLPEYKNTVELIISPNWDRKKIKLVEKIYASVPKELPPYWSVVKYQPFAPAKIYSFANDEINLSDIEYGISFHNSENAVNVDLMIFLSGDLANMLSSAPSADDTGKMWWNLDRKSKKGQKIMMSLNVIIGEYNMIYRVKALDFIPSCEFLDIPRHDITKLHDEFVKIYKNDEFGRTGECNRCGYYSYQTNLIKCENCTVLYCDTIGKICQRGDRTSHSHICGAHT